MIVTDLAQLQVWVATTPIDMRKSFDSLSEVVRSFLGRDPLSGSLFVFRNQRGRLVKGEETGTAIFLEFRTEQPQNFRGEARQFAVYKGSSSFLRPGKESWRAWRPGRFNPVPDSSCLFAAISVPSVYSVVKKKNRETLPQSPSTPRHAEAGYLAWHKNRCGILTIVPLEHNVYK